MNILGYCSTAPRCWCPW